MPVDLGNVHVLLSLVALERLVTRWQARVYWYILTLLQDDPRFIGILDEISESVAMMHDRVLQAESSGDWDSLRALAEIS